MPAPKINFLPYREELRKTENKRYLAILGGALGMAAAIAIAMHAYYGFRMSQQEARNQLLTQDIASLEAQIVEIKTLRQEIAAALARKGVVESLQANRSRAVMILNQIAAPPANIYYKSIKQSGDSIILNGYAPSNDSVSSLITQLASSDIMFDPRLVESKASSHGGVSLIEFTMNAKIIDLAKLAAERGKKKKASAPPLLLPQQDSAPAPKTSPSTVIAPPSAKEPTK